MPRIHVFQFLLITAASVSACYEDGGEGWWDPPVCEAGCVEQPCFEGYPPPPDAPSPAAFDVVVEVCGSLDRVTLGDTEDIRCGNAIISVIWDSDNRPVQIQYGSGRRLPEELHTIEQTFDAAGRLLSISTTRSMSGIEMQTIERSYEWTGDVVTRESMRRTYDETQEDGAETTDGREAGWEDDPRFTDDRIERVLEVTTFDLNGRQTLFQRHAGLAETLQTGKQYTFAESGQLLRMQSYWLPPLDRPFSYPGCDSDADGAVLCVDVLEYDNTGRLVGVTTAGVFVPVSDSCCQQGCVEETAAGL